MRHSVLVCVTQPSAKSFDEDALTRKSVQKNILTRSKVIFQTQEFTNENDVPHIYFQGRTYEHSIQNIKVPIVVRMIPRIWSLWRTNYWQRWLTQVFENVEIFSEQVKEYQMFRKGYEMSVVWLSNGKTDLRDSSGSWRWFSIDLRHFRELNVSKSWAGRRSGKCLREGRGGQGKNVIKDEKFVCLDKNVQFKSELKKKSVVWLFGRLLAR